MRFRTVARKRNSGLFFDAGLYNRETVMKLSLLMTIALGVTSCAASSASKPATPWSLAVVSSGGITGRGAGNYSIDSAGNIALTTPTRQTCSFHATSEQLQRFTDLLAAASPAKWKASYKPKDHCCDRFEYGLTLDLAGTKTETGWIEDPEPMPSDLQALTEALVGGEGSLRAVYGPQCH
jgi:hypothetical protein